MTDPVQPATGKAEMAAKKPRKRRKWTLIACMVLVLVYGACFLPHYKTVPLADGEEFDVIQVSRDAGAGKMFGDDVAGLGEAIVVSYYAKTEGREEARKLISTAEGPARQFNDSLIIIQQTNTPLSRWVPYVRGSMFAFRRTAEGWEVAQ